MKKSLLVLAGEYSGDMHAADVIGQLKQQNPDVECWGIGGEKLRAVGVETLRDIKEMDVVGLSEVLAKYSFFKAVFDEVLAEVDRRKPDAALLIDYPGFNLRLAKELKKRGVKVLYYVCPQVWAWNRGRIPKMAQIIDRLMVIFPFEVDVFKDVDLQVDFVGHPMVDELREFRAEPEVELPWSGSKKIALLPGSRTSEVRYILMPLLDAAKRIEDAHPDVSFLIPVPARRLATLQAALKTAKIKPSRLELVVDQSREVLKQADAAFVASGTATLEAALLGCPTVLVYAGSFLNYLFVKALIRVPWFGITNIVSGKEIMPECLQYDMAPANLVKTMTPFLTETPEREKILRDFSAMEEKLGSGTPAVRVAEIICEELF